MLLSHPKAHDLGIHFEVTQEGLRITEIVPDSQAAHLGLEPGDVIVSVYGHSVHSLETWSWLTSYPNDYAELRIKDGRTKDVMTCYVRLGEEAASTPQPRSPSGEANEMDHP